MKVSQLPYRRVTREEMTAGLRHVIERVRGARSVEEILEARAEYLSLKTEYDTAQSLSYMRYTINTVDPFYLAEKDYYDEIEFLDIRRCGNACREHAGGSHGSGHAHGYTAVLFQLRRRIAARLLYFFQRHVIDALFFLLAQRHGFCGILFQQGISVFCIVTQKLQPPLNKYCAALQTVCAAFRARGKVGH